ncbi:MAG: hypothetical protein ACLSHC_10745 [Bilophila wadsworthia]
MPTNSPHDAPRTLPRASPFGIDQARMNGVASANPALRAPEENCVEGRGVLVALEAVPSPAGRRS